MPAVDRYQGVVVNALQKAGWQVVDSPHIIRIERRSIFVDLTAQRTNEDFDQQIVILEVKGFEDRSAVHNLEEAVGQYMIYRALLDEIGIRYPLYLAVPILAFNGILSERIGQVVRKRLGIKLLVFDVSSEEIVQWLD